MQTNTPDYYQILNLKPDCTTRDIKRQYRILAKRFHPDVNQSDVKVNTERLQQINEAYEVLSDPNKRLQYDEKCNNDFRSASTLEPYNHYYRSLGLFKRRDDRYAILLVIVLLICFIMMVKIHIETNNVPPTVTNTVSVNRNSNTINNADQNETTSPSDPSASNIVFIGVLFMVAWIAEQYVRSKRL